MRIKKIKTLCLSIIISLLLFTVAFNVSAQLVIQHAGCWYNLRGSPEGLSLVQKDVTEGGAIPITLVNQKIIVPVQDPNVFEMLNGVDEVSPTYFLPRAENPDLAIRGVYRGTSFTPGGKEGFYESLISGGEQSRALELMGPEAFEREFVKNPEFNLKVRAFEHSQGITEGSPFLSSSTDIRVASASGSKTEKVLVVEYAVPENRIAKSTYGKPGESELLIGRETKSDWIQNMYSYNPQDKTYTLIGTRNTDGQLVALSNPDNLAGGSMVYDSKLGKFIGVPTPKEIGTKYVIDPKTGKLVPFEQGALSIQ